MTNAGEDAPWVPETRRVPATAIGGERPRRGLDPVAQQRRPFTSMGSSLFDVDAARTSASRANQLEPVRTSSTHRGVDPSSGEFDVRKFLLDHKGDEPLHTTSLFRASSLGVDEREMTPLRSSRKKNLPRVDHPKTSRGGNQVGTSPTSRQSTEDTLSHFYTIEKLSESCFHAVQSKQNKTWQFLPGAEERSKSCSGVSANASSGGANSLTNVERPSRRVDVIDLEKCFDIAMQFVQKMARSDGGASTPQHLATIERDVLTIQAKVAQRYETRSVRIEASSSALDGDEVAAKDELSEEQKNLARTLFEQKWSDVVLGEIEAMLTTSFLEQGMLLRKTRERYARSFFQLERLYNASMKELAVAIDELNQTREELRLASETHALDTQQMKKQYEEEIQRLSVGFEARREDMERKVAESKDQMTKMGDTMKTLNTIFRQMREDTDKVKAVELRENYIKLEKKYETCKEELERLRPLILLNQQLQETKQALISESNALKEKIADFDPIIASKDEIIANLMEQQSELIAAQELRAAQEDELRRLEDEKAAEEEEDEDYRDDENGSPQSRRSTAAPRRVGSAAVCVRCKESLRSMSQSSGLAAEPTKVVNSALMDDLDGGGLLEPRRKKVQCMYFRILLPNLRGRRPQRELSWTLSCMRSILFAKQLDDAMAKRSGGVFPLRIRFPEFVYSWFSPWRSLREEKAATDVDGEPFVDPELDGGKDRVGRRGALNGASKQRTEEQKQLQADEDRWCLYYGVKSLVQDGYLEAKLFLSLLDEKYGEDEQVFMLYCYRVLDVLLSGKVNWGPLRQAVSYEEFSARYEKEFGTRQSSSDLMKSIQSASRVPKTIWISPYHASLATNIVLGKATESERAALDKKLLAFAVTNLPEHERPTVYLTPTNAVTVYNTTEPSSDMNASKHPHSVEKSDIQPLQFVDANLWIELMMMEYKEEQAHRRAAIRLMFQTASSVSSLLGSFGGPSSASANVAPTMDMEQFRIMIRTLNDEIPSFMIATLFRAAYIRGNGSVSFDSFLEAAEYAQFFSSCMRLENPVASIARLHAESGQNDPRAPSQAAALSTSSRAAFLVDKYFTLMHKQLESMTAELPLWTRSLADTLMFELSSSLMDENGSSSGGGALSDGVHLLTTFHRLLDTLLMSSLTKKDSIGSVLSSKSVFSFEKTIQALLDCVRVGEKTTVEQLIDTVRQNLSVKRVQGLFRKHLQRDSGAPLVMRPLFHPSYSNAREKLSARRAERPKKWLLFVIADVLRRSVRADNVQALLLELSSVSSVLLQNTGTARQRLTRDVNGGIGLAPKPLIVELLYDSFVERFGTRSEAERLLHDVFVNCRPLVHENEQLVVLFSYLCCMSAASPDDRLMGQNEALAFLQSVFRCGLHSFHVIHPPPAPSGTTIEEEGDGKQEDLISQTAAEGILFAAFAKLGADQKQRVKMRLDERMTIWKTPGLASLPASMLSGSFALRSNADLTPKQFMPADEFLVLALNEWKRYIQHRMNELRVICCSMEDEIAHFGSSLPLDAIATMLQKAGVTFSNDELCAVFRRMCLTETRDSDATPRDPSEPSGYASVATSGARKLGSTSSQQLRVVDHMSDRLAAACYPLLARETLAELRRLELASPVPFKLAPPVDDRAKFLVETWRAYDEPCRVLLEELRRLGKNHDIQSEAVSRRAPLNGGRAIQREVLYLSSSASTDRLSSQDVAQLEALHTLFLERLEKMTEELNRPQPVPDAQANRRTSMKIMNDLASTRRMSVHAASVAQLLTDETKEALANARVVLVNETWTMFRQLIVMFSRLRALAGLGDGPLADKWDPPQVFPAAPASA